VIQEDIRKQEQEERRLDRMDLWRSAATIKVAQPIWHRVSDLA
jgi:hypothetical protein